MNKSVISILRNKKTKTAEFRRASDKVAHYLALKALDYVKEESRDIETPVARAKGYAPGQDIILLPILRAGLAFLPVFMSYFEDVKVGFVGLKRDEETFVPREYYRNIPPFGKSTLVFILDPMLATGGSSSAAADILLQEGLRQEQIVLVTFISAPEGIKRLKKHYPKIKLITALTDKKLNKHAYIVPGVGDFGDRYFHTV